MGLGGIVWTAVAATIMLGIAFDIVLYDDWRWHREHRIAIERRLAEIEDRRVETSPWGEVVQLHPEAKVPHAKRATR